MTTSVAVEITPHLCKGGFRLRAKDEHGRMWESRKIVPSREEALLYIRILEDRGFLKPDLWIPL